MWWNLSVFSLYTYRPKITDFEYVVKAKPKAPVDIARAKERVKEALKKVEEEESAPRFVYLIS